MLQELTLKSVVGDFVDGKVIDDSGETTFKVTFLTYAHAEGHVVWLHREFMDWKSNLRKVPGVIHIDQVKIHKAHQGGEGSISVDITISGSITTDETKNPIFSKNLMNSIRKALAEMILEYYPPQFNFKNPPFKGWYTFWYTISLDHADLEKATQALRELFADSHRLKDLVSSHGAKMEHLEMPDSGSVSLELRWQMNTSEIRMKALKAATQAYFIGMGFEVRRCKIEEHYPR
jgi:hypothetical protein